MKKYFLYIAIFTITFFIGCDKPGPTELVDEEESFDVEILSKDLDNEYYSNGYDTTGVTEDITQYGSIISISGIKLTLDEYTIRFSSAQTYLFDLNKPFYSSNNTLLGYETIIPGTIRFNNVPARLTDYHVIYREDGSLIDTVLGKKYELFNRHGRILGDPFTFNYNSQISFLFNPFFGGQTYSFEIQTPMEVTGSVKLLNDPDNKVKAELNWNGNSNNNFYIIIGGIKITDLKTFPLYKIKTMDDGKLIIPNSLIASIPPNRFNKLSVTFVRRYVSTHKNNDNNLYVSSQSIHTLIVDMP
jgi:hypothetical protein